jgi:hypothetical protein
VWWDWNLIAGERWSRRIKSELDQSKCVIVVWTKASVAPDGTYVSEWVENEADEGKRRQILVPVMLEEGCVAWTHKQVQCAPLVGWMGDPSHPGLRQLTDGVRRYAGVPQPPKREELAAWKLAEWADTQAPFRDFVNAFPGSRFVEVAEGRIREINEIVALALTEQVAKSDDVKDAVDGFRANFGPETGNRPIHFKDKAALIAFVEDAVDLAPYLREIRHELVWKVVRRHLAHRARDRWNVHALRDEVTAVFGVDLPILSWSAEERFDESLASRRIVREVDRRYAQRAAVLGLPKLRSLEKQVLVSVISQSQTNGAGMDAAVVQTLMQVPIDDVAPEPARLLGDAHLDLVAQNADSEDFDPRSPRSWGRVPADALCPCGTMKAFKDCHTPSALAAEEARARAVKDATTAIIEPPSQRLSPLAPCPCGSGKKSKNCHYPTQ